jgi:hypothetical protein
MTAVSSRCTVTPRSVIPPAVSRKRFLRQFPESNSHRRAGDAPDPRQTEQLFEQLAHPVGGGPHIVHVLGDSPDIGPGQILFQVTQKGFDRHQRALEVVRNQSK